MGDGTRVLWLLSLVCVGCAPELANGVYRCGGDAGATCPDDGSDWECVPDPSAGPGVGLCCRPGATETECAGTVVDAGPTEDAGDAGTEDAGTEDAGTEDAGTEDAGTEDAGTVDGGVPDAGELDGGGPDCPVANGWGARFEEGCIVTGCQPGWADDPLTEERDCALHLDGALEETRTCAADGPSCLPTGYGEYRRPCGALGVGCRPGRECLEGVAGFVCEDPSIRDVVAYGQTTCVLYEVGGDLVCFGSNRFGEANDTAFRFLPSARPVLEDVVKVDGYGAKEGPRETAVACAIVAVAGGQEVRCWGCNDRGQLGQDPTALTDTSHACPDSQGSATPRSVSLPSGSITDVAVGQDHACALIDGDVHCWGGNEDGQLGRAPSAGASLPMRVELGAGATATAIEAGQRHTCAILADRRVACWGANGQRQSGGLTSTDPVFPVAVQTTSDISLGEVEELALGNSFSCARRSDGGVYCWGLERVLARDLGSFAKAGEVLLGSGGSALSGVQGIEAGNSHICARTAGSIRCWGGNLATPFPLGDAAGTSGSEWPLEVSLAGASDLAPGRFHTCALDDRQRVWCWGSDSYYELGFETGAMPLSSVAAARDAPTRTAEFGDGEVVPGERPVQLVVGASWACARGSAGGVACWGSGSSGKLGRGDSRDDHDRAELVTVDPDGVVAIGDVDADDRPLREVVDLSMTGTSTCALTRQGVAFCWGNSGQGRLGSERPEDAEIAIPIPVSDLLTQLGMGQSGGCAVTETGQVICWGNNSMCAAGATCMGDASRDFVAPPQPVTFRPEWGQPLEVVGGNRFRCVRTSLGQVRCFGDGSNGRLGGDTSEARPEPDPAVERSASDPLDGVVGLVSGQNHACALRWNGQVACWGASASGQLGAGPTPAASFAVDVVTDGSAPLTGATVLIAGQNSTCARGTSDELYCWGANENDQLAIAEPDLVTNATVVPAEFGGASGSDVEIEAAALVDTWCALVDPEPETRTARDTAVWCWGPNDTSGAHLLPESWPAPGSTPRQLFPEP